jgi:thiol-disulfide isomerase/thioredoxin
MPDAAEGLVITAPVAAPPLKFTNAKGQPLSLAAYKGHVLVVNLWATWCGPCVEELPTLAALAGHMEAFGGLVLPISLDIGGRGTVEPFYARHGITNLPVLLDPDGENLDLLDTDGVPVTLVIDPQGQLVARVDGAGNWDTPRIQHFLRSLVPVQHKAKPAHVTAL